MAEDFMEYMVKKKREGKDTAIRVLCVTLTVLSVLSFVFFGILSLLLAIIIGVLTVMIVFPSTDIEYEYLYCDKLLTIDKILGQQVRRSVGEFSMERIEIVAPVNSSKLDEYKNRNVQVLEYWSKCDTPDPLYDHKTYAIYYDGKSKLLLDLPEKFVKIMQSDAPRKVFTE